ncbi:MAG TPA: phage tail terminator-like protein [Burkholderiales bacterium]
MSIETIHADLRAAWRTLVLAVVKAQSGALSNVGASGSVLSRASGSWITDGFGVGDEVMVAGFAAAQNNGRALVTAVTAADLTLDKALTTEAAGPAITVTAGLWQGRAWEGMPYAPTRGAPYVSETLRAISSQVRALGVGGTIAHTLLGTLVLFYPAGRGTLAVERMAGAIMKHLKPGTSLSYGTSAGVVTEASRAPLLQEPDWISCPVLITMAAHTTN